MDDAEFYSVDPVLGLVRNGPPPGANGAGHAAPVDSFAAFASLAALLADPAATLAKMQELRAREAEVVDRKLNALAAAGARLAKKELAQAAKEENLSARGLNLQKEYAALEAAKQRMQGEFDEKHADLIQAAHCWGMVCDMASGSINPGEAGNSQFMHDRQTASVLVEAVSLRVARRRPSSEAYAELAVEREAVPFAPGPTTLTRSAPQSKRDRL
jgi:hypothetical protein